MNTYSFKIAIRSILLFIGAAAIAAANPVTWNLANVHFDDGGTASGSFAYDAGSNTMTTWDVVATAGSKLGSFEYTPSNSKWSGSAGSFTLASLQQYPNGFGQNENRFLKLAFASALTNAGGTVAMIPGSLSPSNPGSSECLNCNPYRLVTSGSVTVPVNPVTWNLLSVHFDDGGTASGSFAYDASSNTMTTWDLIVTAGSKLGSFEYTPSNSKWSGSAGGFTFASLQQYPNGFGQTENRYFNLAFASALTNFGGTVAMVPGSLSQSNPGSSECLNCNPYRLVTSGSVSTAPPANPITWNLVSVHFDDGGAASGTFAYDANSNTMTTWDLVMTAGSTLGSFEYTPATSNFSLAAGGIFKFASLQQYPNGLGQNETRFLVLAFASAVTNAGGTIAMIPGSLSQNNPGSSECLNCNPYRLVTSGSITTSSIMPVTWNLLGVHFDDGGTVSGSFSYDANSNIMTNWDLVATAGSKLGSFEYTPSNSKWSGSAGGFTFATLQQYPNGSGQNETRFLILALVSSLTNAGGTISLVPGSLSQSQPGSSECLNCSPYRLVTGGSVSTLPPNTLNPGDQFTITFIAAPNTADILLLFNNDALTLSGSPVFTTNLYDGQKLLGTYTHQPFLLTGGFSRQKLPGTSTPQPLIASGAYAFTAAFAAVGGGSGISNYSPTQADFTTLNNGAINGRLVTSLSGGSVSGFNLPDLVLYDAKSVSGGDQPLKDVTWALNCSLSLSSSSASFPPAGGSGSVAVSGGCPWNAQPIVSWIHVTPGSGVGVGSVSYTVDANSGAARTGTILIGGQTVTITQSAALVCTYSLQPASGPYGAAGGSGTFGVTTTAGCSWTATTAASWIHITSGASGSGNGTVGYSVDANTSTARNDVIQVASQTFSVNQSAAAVGPPAPVISKGGVADPWTYVLGLAPGAWISIYGTNLSNTTQGWSPQLGQPLATTLGGVTVSISGILAPLSYVSPTLVNVLVPAGVPVGPVNIVVSNQGLASAPYPIQSTQYLPAIYPNAAPGTNPPRFYVTAVDPFTGLLVGNVSVDPRVSRAAHPGDTLDLFTIGMGPATPFTTNTDFVGAYPLTSSFTVSLGSTSITPSFAGLVSPGLYQVRITLPSALPAGDQSIQVNIGTASSAQNVFLTIQP